MPSIDIDFEVFKELTVRRATESVSCNDVIRSLLGLAVADSQNQAAGVWIYKGVRFPIGTELRARYKGKIYAGSIDKEGILVGEDRTSSPSDAARKVTQNSVNGWAFWECRYPGESRWRLLKSLQNGR